MRVFAPTSNLPASEKRILPSNGVSITRFGSHKRVDDTLVDWFELIAEEHKRAAFDVLHGYFLPQAGFVATYAGKYLDIPSVVSIRGNDIERAAFDPAKFSHVMYALQNAGAVTTNASELVKKAKAFIDREIVLIPNGIDTEHFKPMEKNLSLAEALGLNLAQSAEESAPQGYGALSVRPVVGFVGELREKKGLKTLLSGYAQLNKGCPTTLLIVGEVRDGADKKSFEEMRSSIPDANIIVTGMISHKDMPAYFSLIDVFVHPSLRDGMPNALLEAMACEKSVVATPVGGVMDVIEDEKNGLLVNVNDASELANTIGKLLDQPEKRLELGRSARETVSSRYSPEQELEANLKVYQKIGIA